MAPPALWRLTADHGKRTRYGNDPYLRESWASLRAQVGTDQAYCLATTTALVWVRPDCFASGGASAVLSRIGRAGFEVLASTPASLDRAGVRGLWWSELDRATAERLLLLDAVVALGPGMLVWLHHPGNEPTRIMNQLKGPNTVRGRSDDQLRSVAQSPNRLLTMVHASDDPADVVRELGLFLPWTQRVQIIGQAWRRLLAQRWCQDWPEQMRRIQECYPIPVPATEGQTVTFGVDRHGGLKRMLNDIQNVEATPRWAAVRAWSARVPLLTEAAQREESR
ncbi:nucleoside-diphosphate kinase [Nocardiopsis synnemataformans]|uniref:nucleoside-diphosphate kinase n=1 Tax=Nocardiopsis synnemataformans TaxID=61305 RepID=UPI003EBA8CB4